MLVINFGDALIWIYDQDLEKKEVEAQVFHFSTARWFTKQFFKREIEKAINEFPHWKLSDTSSFRDILDSLKEKRRV